MFIRKTLISLILVLMSTISYACSAHDNIITFVDPHGNNKNKDQLISVTYELPADENYFTITPGQKSCGFKLQGTDLFESSSNDDINKQDIKDSTDSETQSNNSIEKKTVNESIEGGLGLGKYSGVDINIEAGRKGSKEVSSWMSDYLPENGVFTGGSPFKENAESNSYNLSDLRDKFNFATAGGTLFIAMNRWVEEEQKYSKENYVIKNIGLSEYGTKHSIFLAPIPMNIWSLYADAETCTSITTKASKNILKCKDAYSDKYIYIRGDHESNTANNIFSISTDGSDISRTKNTFKNLGAIAWESTLGIPIAVVDPRSSKEERLMNSVFLGMFFIDPAIIVSPISRGIRLSAEVFGDAAIESGNIIKNTLAKETTTIYSKDVSASFLEGMAKKAESSGWDETLAFSNKLEVLYKIDRYNPEFATGVLQDLLESQSKSQVFKELITGGEENLLRTDFIEAVNRAYPIDSATMTKGEVLDATQSRMRLADRLAATETESKSLYNELSIEHDYTLNKAYPYTLEYKNAEIELSNLESKFKKTFKKYDNSIDRNKNIIRGEVIYYLNDNPIMSTNKAMDVVLTNNPESLKKVINFIENSTSFTSVKSIASKRTLLDMFAEKNSETYSLMERSLGLYSSSGVNDTLSSDVLHAFMLIDDQKQISKFLYNSDEYFEKGMSSNNYFREKVIHKVKDLFPYPEFDEVANQIGKDKSVIGQSKNVSYMKSLAQQLFGGDDYKIAKFSKDMSLDYNAADLYRKTEINSLVNQASVNSEKYFTNGFVEKLSKATNDKSLAKLNKELIKKLNLITNPLERQQAAFDISMAMDVIPDEYINFNLHSFFKIRVGKSVFAHEEILALNKLGERYMFHGEIFGDGVYGNSPSIMRMSYSKLDSSISRSQIVYQEHLTPKQVRNFIENMKDSGSDYITEYSLLKNNCRHILDCVTKEGYMSHAPKSPYKPHIFNVIEKGNIPDELLIENSSDFIRYYNRNYIKEYFDYVGGDRRKVLAKKFLKTVNDSRLSYEEKRHVKRIFYMLTGRWP